MYVSNPKRSQSCRGARAFGPFALSIALAGLGMMPINDPVFAAPPKPAVSTPTPAIKVVYQINEGSEQASRAMVNITNHLNAEPGVKIVVVAFAKGIDFLLDGALDAHGNPFDAAVAGLTQRGVEFRVCHNTLAARGIEESQVNPETRVVPSGVAEIARLQARQGFVYIRP